MTLRRIAVVGASLAGLRAAEALRREGYDGTLALIGQEPHAPYDRPPLSKAALQGTLDPARLDVRRGARAWPSSTSTCGWGCARSASTAAHAASR